MRYRISDYEKHIRLYPVPRGDAEFNEKLSAYKAGKGTVNSLSGKTIPFGLISKIVKFRSKVNLERAQAKGKQRKTTVATLLLGKGLRRCERQMSYCSGAPDVWKFQRGLGAGGVTRGHGSRTT